jgi:hypothetical protein
MSGRPAFGPAYRCVRTIGGVVDLRGIQGGVGLVAIVVVAGVRSRELRSCDGVVGCGDWRQGGAGCVGSVGRGGGWTVGVGYGEGSRWWGRRTGILDTLEHESLGVGGMTVGCAKSREANKVGH